MTKPLRRTAGMNTPTTVPTIVPMPPKRLVPPMTTAAIASRLSVEWPPIVVVAKRASDMKPASPASVPAIAYTLMRWASTLMPARRDASSFDPIAYVYRPKRVAARMTPNTSATAADRVDELEGHVALVDATGDQQRRAERHAERAERDYERRKLRLGDEKAVQQTPSQSRSQRGRQADEDHAPVVPAHLVHGLRRDDAGEHEHGADRE